MSPNQWIFVVLGCLSSACAVASFAWQIISIWFRPLPADGFHWQFQEARLSKIRAGSSLYLWCEPLIRELELVVRRWFVGSRFLKKMEVQLLQGGSALPFMPSEYLAFVLFQSILYSTVGFVVASYFLGLQYALLVGAALAIYVVYVGLADLSAGARERVRQIKRRLPFCVDLMAMTMQAGADFRQSLSTVVAETESSPVGSEMERIDRLMTGGRSLAAAMRDMQKRLVDPEIDEIVVAVTNSETLGSSLAQIFERLAGHIRTRRIQAIEKFASQANTMMVFPGFIISLAALLVIVAPIGLAAMMGPR